MNRNLNPNSTKRRNVLNMGTSLMVVVLMGMAFAVIAALSMSSAKNNINLSERQKQHTDEYYQACSKAYEIIDENSWKDQKFTVEINENQNLAVEIADGEIVSFVVENTSSWESDDSLPVFIGD